MSTGHHSLRHDEDDAYSHQNFSELIAEGYEPDLEGAVTGDQYELLLMYPSSLHAGLLQRKKNPTEIQRLYRRDAVVAALIENKREPGAGSLWIDDIEAKLSKAMGYDKVEISKQHDLLQLVPCITSSLDAHYGVDAFALAWKQEASEEAKAFQNIIKRARLLKEYLDKYATFDVDLSEEKEAIAQDVESAASLLNHAMEQGLCAIATMDISTRPDKEMATFDSSFNTDSTKSDLLVDFRGGIFHRDFGTELEKHSNGTFENRVIQAKNRRSRRTYIARALKVILEWKWESCRDLVSNLRRPGEEAAWMTHAYKNRVRNLLQNS